jgi:heptosyltransferase-2
VAEESRDLLENNPYIHRILPFGPTALAELSVRRFDLVINLDLNPESLSLATLAEAREKKGYGMGPNGEVVLWNAEARDWYEMSHHDRLKRENRLTYQEHMFRIIGTPPRASRIIVNCPDHEKIWVEARMREMGWTPQLRPLIGLNFGAGGRWQQKRWPLRHYAALSLRLAQEKGGDLLLLHGPEEDDDVRDLQRGSGTALFDAGGDNSLARFAAWVSLCDVVVTGDTLCLHMALGLNRRVVALFGPTSHQEIEMYGLGEKVMAEVDCLCCYREECTRKPSCMESLTPDRVYDKVLEQLRHSAERGPASRALGNHSQMEGG